MHTATERAPGGTQTAEELTRRGDTMRLGEGQDVPHDADRRRRTLLWAMTVGRIVLLPVFVFFAVRARDLPAGGAQKAWVPGLLAMILAAMALTDMADGWIARRFELASEAGAIADAAADKVIQVTLVMLFTFIGGGIFDPLPVWFLAIVLGRDLLLGGGWLALKAAGVPFEVTHRLHGRATTVAVFSVLFWVTAGLGTRGLDALLLLTAALIGLSTATYAADALAGPRGSPTGSSEHGSAREVT